MSSVYFGPGRYTTLRFVLIVQYRFTLGKRRIERVSRPGKQAIALSSLQRHIDTAASTLVANQW
jgi:hypothetical protein